MRDNVIHTDIMDEDACLKDIVQVGYAALYTTAILTHMKYDWLRIYFSKRFLDNTLNLSERYIIKGDELKSGADFLELSDSGIFGGLWELAEAENTGLKIYMHDILIRQETVEILECFDVNPYTYPSKGTFIAAVGNGHRLVKELNASGFAAAVIGEETRSNDKVLINGEDIRFLTPVDRLYKDEQDFDSDTFTLRKELVNAGKNIKLY